MKKNKFFINLISKKLIIGFTKRAGRNFFGRKTIVTQSGGSFVNLRIIDFKRVLSLNNILISIEKDINRTGFIGLVCYENGLFSYILLTSTMNKLGLLLYGFLNKFIVNSSTFLLNIPTGNFISHIENKPGNGAKISRAAGCSSFLLNSENNFCFIKMKSGWLLKLNKYCVAIFGKISNENFIYTRVKNAGINRKLGWRPKVRGVAMNPCDHPHGGGEGTGSPPSAQKTPFGKLTKISTKKKKFFLLRKKLYKVF